jgi:hypothetical protein
MNKYIDYLKKVRQSKQEELNRHCDRLKSIMFENAIHDYLMEVEIIQAKIRIIDNIIKHFEEEES